MTHDLVIESQDRVSGFVASVGMKKRPIEARFWEKVDRRGDDECWPWLGSHNASGRPNMRTDRGETTTAARVAFYITHGCWPNVACHKCDNPRCVNPAHIWSGSHSDNIQDALAKGRHHNAAKTHCVRGHEFTPENTAMQGGKRQCRTCHRERHRNGVLSGQAAHLRVVA